MPIMNLIAPDDAAPRTPRPDPVLRVLLSRPALWLGTVLAAFSVVDAVRNAMLHSLDFQWSPVRLLTRHIDPWRVYLAGNPDHQILLNQVPNYLHELYVLLLPLGYLPYLAAKIVWAAINLALVLASCACVARLYELEKPKAWLLAVLVLLSTPFRVVVGNGQVTALILFSLALWAVAVSSVSRGLLLGLSYAKYSVSPVLGMFLLLQRRWRLLMCSVLPPIAGFLCLKLWLPTAAWSLLLEPFRASAHNVSPGLANVMAVTEIVLRRPPLFHAAPDAFYLAARAGEEGVLPYVAALLLAGAIAGYLFWRQKKQTQKQTIDGRMLLACLPAAGLLCFKHQIYDFLLLIFCLALALKAAPSAARSLLFLAIAYFWFVERLMHIRHWEFWPAVVMASFLLLSALIGAAWKLHDGVEWKTAWKLE